MYPIISNICTEIDADVNSSYQIIKKVFPIKHDGISIYERTNYYGH